MPQVGSCSPAPRNLIKFPHGFANNGSNIILGRDERSWIRSSLFDLSYLRKTSTRFYQALGFTLTHEDESIAILKLGSFSFILQNFYAKEFAENCMIQLLVRDVDSWWQKSKPEELVEQFSVNAPREPALQSWGLKVGFIFDPSGVLWHVAEVPF
jgi:hypothetical protein